MKKPENVRLFVLLGLLSVVAIWGGIRMLDRGALAGEGTTSAELQWTPHSLPELAAVEIGGDEAGDDASIERNPFVFGTPPTPTPDPRPRPTPPPRPTRRPPPPRPTPTPTPVGWRRPPNFTMEFLGFFGPAERRVAVFRKKVEDGAEIVVGVEGGVVEKDFIVRKIDLESVVIGYVGYPEKEMKRVPLAQE